MKAWIIEDESKAADRLEKLIFKIDPSIRITNRLGCVASTIDCLKNQRPPDLIFLDIHLEDGLSFEIFKYLNLQVPVIFTTAYDGYALRAFKMNAVDYLLKPIKQEELERSIQKFKQKNERDAVSYGDLVKYFLKEPSPQRFLVRIGSKIRLVGTDEIAYFFSQNKITYLITGLLTVL